MNPFVQEMLTQGEVMRECIKQYNSENINNQEALDKIKLLFQSDRYNRIIFAGMGSSYYAPYSVAGYLTSQGIPAIVSNAYELCHHQFELLSEDTLLVVVSQSGASPEVVELIEKAKARTTVVGIVNQPTSPVAARVDISLFMHSGYEAHISSKSYLCTLVVLQMLALHLTGGVKAQHTKLFEEIADWVSDYLARFTDDTPALGDFLNGTTSYDFLASGAAMSSARQAALIFREGPCVTATAVEISDFSHGWDLSVSPGYTAFIFDSDGKKDSIEEKMRNHIIDKGGKVVLITSASVQSTESLMVIKHPKVQEDWAPMLQIIPCNTIMGWLMGAES
ncbi:MAG: SIS domain-containing protein [Firmicutes bacterium]|nr:SIS domain-containing protein [Bacillota bacterium]